MEIHILQTYLGIKMIERTLITHSLAGKNMLWIMHVKRLLRALQKYLGANYKEYGNVETI